MSRHWNAALSFNFTHEDSNGVMWLIWILSYQCSAYYMSCIWIQKLLSVETSLLTLQICRCFHVALYRILGYSKYSRVATLPLPPFIPYRFQLPEGGKWLLYNILVKMTLKVQKMALKVLKIVLKTAIFKHFSCGGQLLLLYNFYCPVWNTHIW